MLHSCVRIVDYDGQADMELTCIWNLQPVRLTFISYTVVDNN